MLWSPQENTAVGKKEVLSKEKVLGTLCECASSELQFLCHTSSHASHAQFYQSIASAHLPRVLTGFRLGVIILRERDLGGRWV